MLKNKPDVIFYKTKRPTRTFLLNPEALPALGDMKNGCATLIPPSFFSLSFLPFYRYGRSGGGTERLVCERRKVFLGGRKKWKKRLAIHPPHEKHSRKNTVFSKYSYFKKILYLTYFSGWNGKMFHLANSVPCDGSRGTRHLFLGASRQVISAEYIFGR